MAAKRLVALLAAVGGAMAAASTLPAASDPTTYFVRIDGDDAHSGADWEHAQACVGAAIQAAGAGDEIWVAAGVHAERVRNRVVDDFSVDVAPYGGFAGFLSDEAHRKAAEGLSYCRACR